MKSTPSTVLAVAALLAAVTLATAQPGVPTTNRAGSSPSVQQGTPRALPGTSKPTTSRPTTTSPKPAASRVVYVKTADAPIRSASGGGVIATAQQGAALSVLSEDKLQFRVRLSDGREGVIAKRLVQDKPPSRGGLGIVVADDRRPTEMGTGASARGLRETTKTTALREGVDQQAVASVETMESYATTISEARVAEFAKQGGIQK